jgi:serine phosphatase RsbU (regulator of sigma subunit)
MAEIDCKVYALYGDGKDLWLGTDSGLGFINDKNFGNIQFITLGNDISVKSIISAKNKNYLWLGTNSGVLYFSKISRETEFVVDSKEGLSGNEIASSGLYLDRSNILWIGTYHGLSNFNLKAKTTIPYSPNCFIEKILLNGKKGDIKSGSKFRYNQNNFVFEISALSFSNEESIEYEIYLRGTDNNYSSYHTGKEYKAYYNNLPPGKYTFIYKARGQNDIWGYSRDFEFEINKAWYNTWIFRICALIMFFTLLWHLYKIRIKKIEEQKLRLEKIVSERTADLKKANLEIEKQRDLATDQRDMIFEQKKEITDSINYAERIQRSLLPQSAILKSVLPEHFIFFKPRDVVSGDFYWIAEKSHVIYAAAVDCTGHGVPGALMSMLGISFLNEIVNKAEEISPDEILNQLRISIIKVLRQSGKVGESRDGMDVSLLAFNKLKMELKFAGANNPLYHFRGNNFNEYKGNKMPVGIHEHMEEFTCNTLEIIKGDTVYLFSDGYADQFGGPKGKKFMYSNFKKLLLDLQPKSMCEQLTIISSTMENWRGSKDQVDDIVVIGIRF